MACAPRRLPLALLLAGAVGCGRSGGPAADGGSGPPDGGTGSGLDVAPPRPCGSTAECGPDQFCNLPGQLCVSAVASVAAGSVHTCALHRDGRVSCWGYGPFIGPGLPIVTTPRFIDLPERAVGLAVGIQAACALLGSGEVRCWGDLGQGPEGAERVVGEDGAALTAVRRLAGGSAAFCAVSPIGVHCWGANAASELARPPALSFPPRTAVLVLAEPRPLIAATVAILVHDGISELCGWGNNDSGILPGPRGLVERPTCARMVPGVVQLSAGDGHVCARRGGNAFSCWGSNSGGQLGTGDEGQLEVAMPGALTTLPAEIDAVESGAYHTCALLRTGKVHCWGSNEHGECGLPSSAPPFAAGAGVPIDRTVMGLGSGAGAQHSCAIASDGSVHCWGYDNEGQLGSGVISRDQDRASANPLPVRW